MIYTEKYTTTWHDTGANRAVRPTQILMYMQETANHHCAVFGIPLDKLRDERGLAFLLSRITLKFYEELYAYDEIEVQTWISEGKGLSFPRCFRIMKEGRVVAEAVSNWALMDIRAGKLVRYEDFDYGFEGEPMLEMDAPRRIKFPSDVPLDLVGERKIVYSDLDYNMHMNNTKYPDMVCDFIDGIEDKKLRSMTLIYLREAHYKDTLSVYLAQKENEYFVRTVNTSAETCLESQMNFE
jgi:acyl-CoA thioesterase FadM